MSTKMGRDEAPPSSFYLTEMTQHFFVLLNLKKLLNLPDSYPIFSIKG
jgi:hypothetical protein